MIKAYVRGLVQIMDAQIQWLGLSILVALSMAALNLPCRAEEPIPKLNYEAVPDFFQLPPGEHFVEVAGVAVNSKGHILVFHRGKHPLMEFDASGKFVRRPALAFGLTTTTLGVLLGWGMKGSGPGQFDLPHSIAIDGDLVYVGDRENARIQIFDLNGRYLREWKLGHPFGLFIAPDHFIYMSDAMAGRILKINRDGKAVGVLDGPAPDKGRHFDPHSLAVDKDNSIFTAEVMPWRAQKFHPK